MRRSDSVAALPWEEPLSWRPDSRLARRTAISREESLARERRCGRSSPELHPSRRRDADRARGDGHRRSGRAHRGAGRRQRHRGRRHRVRSVRPDLPGRRGDRVCARVPGPGAGRDPFARRADRSSARSRPLRARNLARDRQRVVREARRRRVRLGALWARRTRPDPRRPAARRSLTLVVSGNDRRFRPCRQHRHHPDPTTGGDEIVVAASPVPFDPFGNESSFDRSPRSWSCSPRCGSRHSLRAASTERAPTRR